MKIDPHLLKKYWSEECTPDERKVVEAWMASGIPEGEWSLRQQNDDIAKRKAILWKNIRQETAIENKKSVLRKWPTAVAVAVVFIGSLFLGLPYLTFETPSQSSKEVSFVYVDVPLGKKQKLTLTDGTVIILNSGTTLRYPLQFEADKREVFLDGEAFFEVAKDPHKPFLVHTKKTSTRVLGTRFNLLSRGTSTDILTVEEGRVQFTAVDCVDTMIVTANMQSIYDGAMMTVNTIKSDLFNAWTKEELIFNNQTLREVIPELERWYAVQIICTDAEILNYQVKGKFKQASLATVLHDISFAMSLKYKIKDKEVSLYR